MLEEESRLTKRILAVPVSCKGLRVRQREECRVGMDVSENDGSDNEGDYGWGKYGWYNLEQEGSDVSDVSEDLKGRRKY